MKMTRLFENVFIEIEAFKMNYVSFIKITRLFEDISRKMEAFF
jgi:hypothetical protein